MAGSGFWERALGGIPPAPAQQQYGQPSARQQNAPADYRPAYQAPVPAGDLPAYVQQQLAIRKADRRDVDLAQHIRHEGYISRPPEWVQKQPHDVCPNCRGVSYAAVGGSGYAQPSSVAHQQFQLMRCFECGYANTKGISPLWGTKSSGPVVGAAVQSRDGTISLRNTGLIQVQGGL